MHYYIYWLSALSSWGHDALVTSHLKKKKYTLGLVINITKLRSSSQGITCFLVYSGAKFSVLCKLQLGVASQN